MSEITNYLEKVPNLPLEKICEKSGVLTLADVLDLSLTTDQLKSNVRDMKLKIAQLEVAFVQEFSYIFVRTAHNMSLKWGFHQTLPEGHEQTIKRKIGHYTFRTIKTDEGIFTDHYNIEDGIPAVLKYFVGIFDFSTWEINALSIDMSVIAEFRVLCEAFKIFRKINKFVLTRTGAEPFNPILYHTILDFLERHDFEHVYMGVNTDNGAQLKNRAHHRFQKLLSVDHVHIVYAEWINSDNFLNLDVKTIIIGQDNLITAEDLNAFIKKWLESESTKLMWLKVNHVKKFNKTVVLNGFTTQPARRQSTFVKCPFLCTANGTITPFEWKSAARQMTRADGSIATIAVTDDCFFFHVSDSGPQPTYEEPNAMQERANRPEMNGEMEPINDRRIDLFAVHRRMMEFHRRGVPLLEAFEEF